MKEIAVLLMSHGHYAKEALHSAEMIIGQQENVATISVIPEKTLDSVMMETSQAFTKLDTSSGILLLADILGGTPSNVAGNLVLTKENVLAVTGFNLPMLLELFVDRSRNLAELEQLLVDAHGKSCHVLNVILSKEEDENEHSIS